MGVKNNVIPDRACLITTFLNPDSFLTFMKRLLVVSVLLLSLFLSACSGAQVPSAVQDAPASAPADVPTAGNSVTIQGFAFSPAELTVKKGTTVTWTNQDSAPHTVTSDSGSELSSATLSKGQSYSHTFNEAGTFEYHCNLHSTMKAKVMVE